MVSVEYAEAAVEVLGILEHLDNIEKNKIPRKILEFLENNKSKTYNPNIDYTDDVKNLKLKEKTREILAGLYVDYLCPEEEKQEYINKLKKNEINYQENLKLKYNPDNLFKNRKTDQEQEKIINNSIIIVKNKNIFLKFINMLKKIFK